MIDRRDQTDDFLQEDQLRAEVRLKLVMEMGREPSENRIQKEIKRQKALVAMENGGHRQAFGPDLQTMHQELERWVTLSEDPRNQQNEQLMGTLTEKIRLTQQRIQQAEGTYRITQRRDALKAELKALGRETPKEKLLRLEREKPYGFHLGPEYLADRDVQHLHERRNGHHKRNMFQ